MSTLKKLSIIIPALNEEEGITKTVRAIPKDELQNLNYEVQILVVDNGSEDNTSELARKAGAEVVFEPKQGYGNAYKAGFSNATGEIIATADADGTYPVEDIPLFMRILEEENLDFLTTDRFTLLEKGVMSFQNKLGNHILSLFMRLLFRLNIKDSQSGMWVIKRDLLNQMMLRSNSMALSQEVKIEACHFCKARWKETPISYRHRLGSVKLRSWRDGTGNLLNLIKKRITR